MIKTDAGYERVTNRQHLSESHWDAIVIGTGIGGGTLGYQLAKAGKRVLFLEKGRSYLGSDDDLITGIYAEDFISEQGIEKTAKPSIMGRALRYADPIREAKAKRPYDFSPLIGEGSGGSSALYGMVMERFFREDLSVSRFFPDSGANLPDWPINYDAFRPYYIAAEKLYRVRGTLDPLREEWLDPLMPPPQPSPPSLELFNSLVAKGRHPYWMPMACEYVDGCRECIGCICPGNCKNDSARICLRPAIEEHGAILLDKCKVTRLVTDASRVTAVHCRHKDQDLRLRADLIILAAGTLHTPEILLRSSSENWPNGLANRSGLVGKYLMRHFFDLYCVKTQASISDTTFTKQIALNDAYFTADQKLGTIQAVGRIPKPDALVTDLKEELERKVHPFIGPLLELGRPFVRLFAKHFISRRLILTAIMEDLPYEYNRVALREDSEGIAIHYRINEYEKARIAAFRNKVREVLKPHRYTFINNAENNERLAHACGTCRFGNDPNASVLDTNNRAHSIDNLYVVDASFFPTGSGINPSLTLAANAIRVGEHILAAKS